jgi:hypothetical protein
MKGFPKVLKTKEDYYNCLAMVASGELEAADLLAKIESAENQRYIECGVAAVEEEKKAVTVYYCDEAAVGMKFVAGDVSGTVQGVTHIQTDEAAAAGEAGNDRTALTLSKAVKAGCKVIALERTDTVAGMTTDDIAALKGVLKQYEYYKKYAAGNGTKYYRVRKSWTDAASQLGAFTSLENAKSACKAGYTVYDDNGKAVYTAAGQQASAGVPFSVQVDILDLNIRTGAGTNYAKTGETTGKGVFTIVEVKAGQGASVGWGRLKSGAGWISLDYATRLA